VLEINWCEKTKISNKGTFKEAWNLTWKPELWIQIIEKSPFGNTLEDASTHFLLQSTKQTNNLTKIVQYLDLSILADLPKAVDFLMQHTNNMAAQSNDILELMSVLAKLAQTTRYGTVRKTDLAILEHMIDTLVARVLVGLVYACLSMDNETSLQMYEALINMNQALKLLQNEENIVQWNKTLENLTSKSQVNGILVGGACKILTDNRAVESSWIVTQFSIALSQGNTPEYATQWLEGFLKNSGTILLYDEILWNIFNDWLSELNEENFMNIQPLLRRTFSTFSPVERQKLGEKIRKKTNTRNLEKIQQLFDKHRAEASLSIVSKLLGI
jgi:hypothetical protein